MFINSSVISSATAGASPETICTLQSGLTGGVHSLSSSASKAISGSVANASSSITGGLVGINGALSSAGSITSQVNSTINSITSLQSTLTSSASNYLQSAMKSITGTFSGAVKSLASGIDSNLSKIFSNTNIKAASTITSLISDPVKTNLLNAKPPASSAFKISSLEAGSQSVGVSGSSSQFGTNASSMIGTNLSTLLNRLNLDSVSNLASGIANSKSALAIGGLFSDVKNIAKTVQAVTALPGVIKQTVANSLSNDIQSFLGRTSALSSATGIDVSSFFLNNPITSLLDENGNAVDTGGSGIDATTGNAILEIARLVGCDTSTLNYNSANEIESLFNLILSLASTSGMTSLVNSLLGCSLATSAQGQIALSNAFVNVAGTDAAIASSIVDNIDNKSALNTDYITQSIVTNSNLSAADVNQVDYIMQSIGTTTDKAYSVSSVSDDTTAVYNVNTLTNSEKSFLDSLFEDKTLSTYVGGTVMSLQPNGTLWI